MLFVFNKNSVFTKLCTHDDTKDILNETKQTYTDIAKIRAINIKTVLKEGNTNLKKIDRLKEFKK